MKYTIREAKRLTESALYLAFQIRDTIISSYVDFNRAEKIFNNIEDKDGIPDVLDRLEFQRSKVKRLLSECEKHDMGSVIYFSRIFKTLIDMGITNRTSKQFYRENRKNMRDLRRNLTKLKNLEPELNEYIERAKSMLN